jgi:hypothetical protein
MRVLGVGGVLPRGAHCAIPPCLSQASSVTLPLSLLGTWGHLQAENYWVTVSFRTLFCRSHHAAAVVVSYGPLVL